MKAGLDQPEQVHQPDEHDPHRDLHQPARLPLQAAGKQDGERKNKVQEDQSGSHDFPVAVHAVKVPANFIGQVAGPDNQPLRE